MGSEPIFAGAGASPLETMDTKYLASTLPQTLQLKPSGNGPLNIIRCNFDCIKLQKCKVKHRILKIVG